VVPFTFIDIMSVNRRWLDPANGSALAKTRRLLAAWTRRHAVRTVPALAAFVCSVCQLAH